MIKEAADEAQIVVDRGHSLLNRHDKDQPPNALLLTNGPHAFAPAFLNTNQPKL
jgi:hypothetical protein